MRRPSRTTAGEEFRRALAGAVTAYGPGTRFTEDFVDFMDSFMRYTKTEDKFFGILKKEAHDPASVINIDTPSGLYNNVAIICGYQKDGNSGHAVAYVKMNHKWYVGDNEKGMLILRQNGAPVWDTKYAGDWNMSMMCYLYISEVLPVCHVPELNSYGFHGKISFKQHVSSCWGDSIQTVIMNANGFREQFLHLYNLVNRARMEYPIFQADVTVVEAIGRNINALERILKIQVENEGTPQYKLCYLLSLCFVRMMTWEHEYGTSHTYVNHIEGATGIHLLEAEDTLGREPGPHIQMVPFGGGKRTNKKTRKN